MNAKETVSFKTFFTFSVIVIAGCWAWASVNTRIISNSEVIKANVGRIDAIEELYHRSSDRWTGSEMRAWADELKRLNPDLRLPAIPNK